MRAAAQLPDDAVGTARPVGVGKRAQHAAARLVDDCDSGGQGSVELQVLEDDGLELGGVESSLGKDSDCSSRGGGKQAQYYTSGLRSVVGLAWQAVRGGGWCSHPRGRVQMYSSQAGGLASAGVKTNHSDAPVQADACAAGLPQAVVGCIVAKHRGRSARVKLNCPPAPVLLHCVLRHCV